jgi:pilin isopeptide linkage protein
MSVNKRDHGKKRVNRRKGMSTAKLFGILAVLLVGAIACFTIHPALADDSQNATVEETQDVVQTPDDQAASTSVDDTKQQVADDSATTTSDEAATAEENPVAEVASAPKKAAAANDPSTTTTTDTSTTVSDTSPIPVDTKIGTVNVSMKATISNYTMREGILGYSLVLGKSANTDGENVLGTASVAADGSISISTDKLTASFLNSLINEKLATVTESDGGYVVTVPCDVIEDTTQLAGSGISCDVDNAKLPVDVTITIPKGGEGTAAVTYPSGDTFTNTYSTNDAYLNMYGAKLFVVNGATVTVPADVNGKFTFKLTASAGAPLPEKYGTGKSCTETTNEVGNSMTYNPVDFGQITFTDADLANVARGADGQKSITYTYTVTEEPNSDTSYMPFNSSETIKVTVTDNGSGRLTVSAVNETSSDAFTVDAATGESAIVIPGSSSTGGLFQFTNMYTEGTTTATIAAKKVLNGRDLTAGEFKFQLIQNGTVLQTVSNAADGSVTFSPITYSEAGTTTYTIKEVTGDEKNVTYSTDTITATVKVVENKDTGKLTATVTYSPDDATITNTFKAQAVDVDFAASKTITGKDLADGEFSFELVAPDGTVVQTVTNAADGSVSFDPVAIDEAGTYTYTIQEVRGDEAGVTYDKTPIKATVTVSQNSTTGELTAGTVTYSPDPATFSNQYTASAVQANFAVTKTLTGKNLLAGEFTFQLIDPDGNVDQTVTNAADGSVTFHSVNFFKAGTYTFKIEEVNDKATGVTYDDSVITATVEVKQNETTGALETPVVTYSPTNATFSNTFTASAIEVPLSVTKELTGKSLQAGEFSFELLNSAGTVLQTVTNAADGTVSFKPVSVDKAGTYTYTIREVAGDVEGMTYDTTPITAAFKVSQNTDTGELTAGAVTYSPDATFSNTFTAKALSVPVSVSKTLEGKPLQAGEFTFQLIDSEGTVVQTATNDANGTVDFKPLSIDKPGTYTYKIKEVAGTVDGMSYDAKTITCAFFVTQNETTGELSVGNVVYDPVDATFANTYTAKAVDVPLSVTKTITGKDLEAGEFSFELVNSEGTVVQTVANAADGSVTFSPISVSKAGTYTYTIQEVRGDEAGVTYDKTPIKATFDVSQDPKTGELTAGAVTYSPDAAFSNTFKAGTVQADFAATKVLDGKDLKAGEFTFELVGPDGTVDQTATNAADGTVDFKIVNFDKAGTYAYQIREVAGTETGVTYDTTVYTATVKVTEDQTTGKLTASEVSYSATPVFHNTFTATAIPVTLTVGKSLVGETLADKQFGFDLVDPMGRTIQTVRNDSHGHVTFAPVKIAKAGTYVYTITERNEAAKGITYDPTLIKATVVVAADPETGELSVQSVTYGPKAVFQNKYVDEREKTETDTSTTKTDTTKTDTAKTVDRSTGTDTEKTVEKDTTTSATTDKTVKTGERATDDTKKTASTDKDTAKVDTEKATTSTGRASATRKATAVSTTTKTTTTPKTADATLFAPMAETAAAGAALVAGAAIARRKHRK